MYWHAPPTLLVHEWCLYISCSSLVGSEGPPRTAPSHLLCSCSGADEWMQSSKTIKSICNNMMLLASNEKIFCLKVGGGTVGRGLCVGQSASMSGAGNSLRTLGFEDAWDA